MAILFAVQNDLGTVDLANSYATTAELLQYFENLGTDYSAKTTSELQIALIKGQVYLDNRWTFRGLKLEDDQTTSYPRSGVTDCGGVDVDGVPLFIKNAQIEYAGRVLEGVSLTGDISSLDAVSGRITKAKLDTLEVTYQARVSASGLNYSFPSADNYLVNSCTLQSSANMVGRA